AQLLGVEGAVGLRAPHGGVLAGDGVGRLGEAGAVEIIGHGRRGHGVLSRSVSVRARPRPLHDRGHAMGRARARHRVRPYPSPRLGARRRAWSSPRDGLSGARPRRPGALRRTADGPADGPTYGAGASWGMMASPG